MFIKLQLYKKFKSWSHHTNPEVCKRKEHSQCDDASHWSSKKAEDA